MTGSRNNRRKRGIKASRSKLTRALTAKGFRTQAALAERIADAENLDVAPKDMVNRAFRELPVELQSLERIARALGVEAHTLYKTEEEDALQAQTFSAMENSPGARYPGWRTLAVVAAAVVASLAGAWWYSGVNPTGEQGNAEALSLAGSQGLTGGKPTLALLSISGDQSGGLSDALRESLSEYFNLTSETSSALTRGLDSRAASNLLRSDASLDGEVVTVGRLSGLRFYLYTQGVRQQVWAESLPVISLPDRRARISDNVVRALRFAMKLKLPDRIRPDYFPLAPVQDDYLEGEYHLSQPANELNIKRALTRFEAALRQDANYASAHAGLCHALLEEYWMTDAERALKDASRACGQAVQLDANNPVVGTAHAHFLRRSGRNDEAIVLYQRQIAKDPHNTTALSGLASSQLDAFRQDGDRDKLLLAKQAAQAAADADPMVWKPLWALATMEWFDGNLNAAIDASEAALARNENENILGNLGTFYLCQGAFLKARDTYLRAGELAPHSYVGDEFLGMSYYFLGEFAQSAKLRRRAIDTISMGTPEIHEMWGNLGDSYRQAGSADAAIDAYLRAAEIAERDFLRGPAPVSDRAARAYYYTMLRRLDPAKVPDGVDRKIQSELDDIAASLTSATAHRRMAITWLVRNEREKARRSLEQATEICPGYAGLPDLAALREAPAGQ